jgi:DNA-binding PadR family transcriptional regulator
MDPEKFLRLDSVIHAPIRLAVLSILISVENAQFTFLKESTGTTDGNLHTHLAKLANHGFISIRKTFAHNKPMTLCAITDEGREAFAGYLDQLEQIVKAQKKPGGKTEEKNQEKQERRKESISLDFSPENPYLD